MMADLASLPSFIHYFHNIILSRSYDASAHVSPDGKAGRFTVSLVPFKRQAFDALADGVSITLEYEKEKKGSTK